MSGWKREDPGKAARDRQRAELIAKSPLRKPAMQFGVDGLDLFDADRSPKLF